MSLGMNEWFLFVGFYIYSNATFIEDLLFAWWRDMACGFTDEGTRTQTEALKFLQLHTNHIEG